MAKLTAKQRRFVEEYLIDKNATRAFRAAGYALKSSNDDSVRGMASELLAKPIIREAIDTGLALLAMNSAITTDRVLAELAAVGFSDIGDFLDLETFDFKKPPRMARRAIQSVKVRTEKNNQGEVVATVTEFRLHNKLQALEALARHLNLFKELGPLDQILAQLGPFGTEVKRAMVESLRGRNASRDLGQPD